MFSVMYSVLANAKYAENITELDTMQMHMQMQIT